MPIDTGTGMVRSCGMSKRPVAERVLIHNAGRESERLAMKYKAMRKNAFAFMRGSCRLFYDRMAEHGMVPDGPAALLCGDLHLENFGTYRSGDGGHVDGHVYFDVNDFDEAVRGPHTLDIVRLAASVMVGAETIALSGSRPREAAHRAVTYYLNEVAAGAPRSLDKGSATGPIGDLIKSLAKRDPAKFVDKRTVRGEDGQLAVKVDGDKALALADGEKKLVAAFCASLVPPRDRPRAFTYLDAARRIAGTGSLGILRNVVLVEGEGAKRHWLLDMKGANASAFVDHVGPQPHWDNDAHRIVAIQSLLQDAIPALLAPHPFAGAPIVLKQLQPSADRLDLEKIAADHDQFDGVIEGMAKLAAWGHLRAAGHHGAVDAKTLATGANRAGLVDDLVKRAVELAAITDADFAAYATAYDRGEVRA